MTDGKPAPDRRARSERLRDRMANTSHRARRVGRPERAGVVLDAVTVIALLDPGNAHHAAARETVQPLAGMPKLIHPINLAEVLVKPVQDGIADKVLTALTRAGITTFTPAVSEPLDLARVRAFARIKMPDACACSTAAARNLPLVTFDKRLATAARTAGLTVLGAPGH